jgi:hypothetical protein
VTPVRIFVTHVRNFARDVRDFVTHVRNRVTLEGDFVTHANGLDPHDPIFVTRVPDFVTHVSGLDPRVNVFVTDTRSVEDGVGRRIWNPPDGSVESWTTRWRTGASRQRG